MLNRALAVATFFVLCCCSTYNGGTCCADVYICGTLIPGCYCSPGAGARPMCGETEAP